MKVPFPFGSSREKTIHLVGIKGTGMSALAELLFKNGIDVKGSDVPEPFYTDQVLASLHIPFQNGFSKENIGNDTGLVIYSAAYDPDTHPELVEAHKRTIETLPYHQALGLLSGWMKSCGIAGVHGKTTTTAMAGTLARGLDLPISVLVGSAVSSLGGGSVYAGGSDYFIAETCEYKRHFLSFTPSTLVITSVEPDHLDYYSGMADITAAFTDYAMKLPENGELIWCADDAGAAAVARDVLARREDLVSFPYGEEAEGDFRITRIVSAPGLLEFSLQGVSFPFHLRYPGVHNVLNGTAALCLVALILQKIRGVCTREDWMNMKETLAGYTGSKRRSEIIGEARGVLFMDDYGHHPTAIKTTLAGLRSFYPGRRLIVDFMSHTYSRTGALLEEFAASFGDADAVILHKIYASAREQAGSGVSGKDLCKKMKHHHNRVEYFHEVMDAAACLRDMLRPGDIFLTLGAGDNWRLGKELYFRFAEQ